MSPPCHSNGVWARPCPADTETTFTTLVQTTNHTTATEVTALNSVTQSTNTNDIPTTNTTKGTPNQPEELSNKAGVTVGIVAAVVIVLAVVVLLVLLLRRQKCMKGRFAQRKKQRIINNDYVGNQSIALSDNTNDNLPTQDGHNYHEITTDFSSPNETTTYFEIDDVINSTIHSENDNKKDGPIDKNNYFALDPQETGFNRFPTKTPDIDNEIFSNENDPKVAGVHQNETLTQLSQYTVLDPNETGFNRTNKINPTTVYELAQPSTSTSSTLEPSQTEKDMHNIATSNSYDVTNFSEQKELDENVYNHMCDSDYDKLKHIRRDTDATNSNYDHFRVDKT